MKSHDKSPTDAKSSPALTFNDRSPHGYLSWRTTILSRTKVIFNNTRPAVKIFCFHSLMTATGRNVSLFITVYKAFLLKIYGLVVINIS